MASDSSLYPVAVQAVNGGAAPTFVWGDQTLTLRPYPFGWGIPARELGRFFGYADDGKRLVTKITGEWADEFDEGVEFVRGASQAIESKGGTESVPPPGGVQPEAIILTCEGIHGACLKTNKPIGKETRKWLRREVMVSIQRTGSYIGPAPVEAPKPPPIDYGPIIVALTAQVNSLTSRVFSLEAAAKPPTTPRLQRARLCDRIPMTWGIRDIAELIEMWPIRHDPFTAADLGTALWPHLDPQMARAGIRAGLDFMVSRGMLTEVECITRGGWTVNAYSM